MPKKRKLTTYAQSHREKLLEIASYNEPDKTEDQLLALVIEEERVQRDIFMGAISSKQGALSYLNRWNDCSLFSKTFTGNSISYHDEGRRSVALTEIEQLIWALDIEGPYAELKLLNILSKTGGIYNV